MNLAQIKTERLQAIENEVEHLHPLLNVLLPKLPRVSDFEYTHGTNEFGADFVLARQEDTFGDQEYIGVIAKIGKVTQDFTDIERQIGECEMERTFRNGRLKVFITEIWVVATGHISYPAQQKIHHKYKTRKIVFINGERLSHLIDKYLPNYWTDVPLRVGDFLHTISADNDTLDRCLSLIPTKDGQFYIEQDLYEVKEPALKKDPQRKKKRERVDLLAEISGSNIILVEGGMGSGKSKLLRKLVGHFSTPQEYIQSRIIPIFVSFREFVDKYDLDPAKLVEARVPAEVTQEAHDDLKYLLLIDGADEKDLPPTALAEALLKISKTVTESNMKAIIASRWCEAFVGNTELHKNLKHLELVPLSTARLIEFLRKLCTNFDHKSRLIEDLKKSTLFKELPRSPIAAIILAQLINDNAKELPSNLTELFAKYTELSLGRWDVDKGLRSQKEYEALSYILTDLAVYFLDTQTEIIPLGEAKGRFNSYLAKRNLGLNSEHLFSTLVKRCDLVAIDQANDTFRFKHRTFVEFFYARAFLRKPFHIDSRAWHPYWINTFYFYVGLQKDCPETLQAIIDIKPDNEGERWMRIVTVPHYLLAGFASPYDIAERSIYLMMTEAAQLYHDISTGNIQSPFGKLPKMQFLWLMQHVIRKGYGYDFFKEAIVSVALALDEKCENRQECSVALFFLSAISTELATKDSFDFLIDKYSKDLPVELELAIRHEGEKLKHRSALLKKLDKRLERALAADKSLDYQVARMYDTPMTKELPTKKRLKGSGLDS